jgi:hypothetical protein
MANAAWLALTVAAVKEATAAQSSTAWRHFSTSIRGHDAVLVEERLPVGWGTHDRRC